MALEGGFTIDTIFKTLPTRLALEGLQQILSRNIPRALVGYLNYDNGGVYLLEKSGVLLSSDLVGQLEVYKEKRNRKKQPKHRQ